MPRLVAFGFFISGLLLVFSFAPFGLYLLAPALLLPFLFSTLYCAPRQAAWHGFSLGAGLFLAGTYWLYISIHVFGNAPLVLAIALMLALVCIMGLYFALCGWLTCRLAAGDWRRHLVAAPVVFVLVEWLRGWFLSGFPWMSIGYGQIDSPLAGFAPVTGVYGVSLMLILSAAAVVAAAANHGNRRAIFLMLSLSPWLVGVGLQQIDWTATSGPPLRTTIVQGGVSQDRKWLPEQFAPTLDLYRKSIAANPGSKLLVWPEVAIPATRDQVQPYVETLRGDLAQNSQSLLFGILERQRSNDGEGRELVFNSVFSLAGGDEQVYRKRHLVPFGEYFPVPDFVREWMRLMSLPYSDISAGAPEQPLLMLAGGLQMAVAICYEDAYGAEQLYALPAANVLINVSNDAWFGDSIAPHQHLEIARMRAKEAGRPVVRATNNGVSAFIGPRGELQQTGDQFRYVDMTADVVPHSGTTPYVRSGNWPVIVLCSLLFLSLSYRLRERRK